MMLDTNSSGDCFKLRNCRDEMYHCLQSPSLSGTQMVHSKFFTNLALIGPIYQDVDSIARHAVHFIV